MIKEKIERNCSIDLMRIVCMAMVVCLHFFSHGGVMAKLCKFSMLYYCGLFINYLCIVAVNCFVLTSGYFLVERKFSFKKLFNLWMQVSFYSIFVFLLAIYLGVINFNYVYLFRSLFPITSSIYWFISAYFILYIFSPYLNKFISGFTKTQFKYFLFGLIFLFSIIPSINIYATQFKINYGYSFVWFIVLYLTGAYIKLYYKNTGKNVHKYLYGYVLLAIFIVVIRSFLAYNDNTFYPKYLSAYNNILVFIESILLFLYFENLKISNKEVENLITKVSPLVLGVYLLHEVPYMRKYIWDDLLHPSLYVNDNFLYCYMIVCIGSIFGVGILVEWVRRLLLKCFNNKIKQYLGG